jgi:peptide-methionine (R)-S-oxide reductase
MNTNCALECDIPVPNQYNGTATEFTETTETEMKPKLLLRGLCVLCGLIAVVMLWSLFPIYPQAEPNRIQKPAMEESQEALQARLTPEQFYVTQQKGTEAPFSGKYWNHHEDGVYRCVVCGAELFTSESKFDSGCGWPSFDRAANETNVDTNLDTSHGMVRDEITCNKCGAHLGHVFNDGPTATGLRYCVNSASIDFEAKDE